jgi:colicin import membrane protein
METKLAQFTVNPEEYGLQAKQAEGILGNLPQITMERTILEKQYEEVIVMDINDPETAKIARGLRLMIRDNRTKGIQVWHKTTKDYFLKGSQFIDAIRRKEEAVNERMETNLEEIEKYREIQEAKRIAELEKQRIEEITPYYEFVPFGIKLGNLPDEEYQKVFNGAKLQYDDKIRREQEAIQRAAEEKRLKEIEDERIRKENEKLQKANEKLQKEKDKEIKRIEKENRDKQIAAQEAFRLELEEINRKRAEEEKAAKELADQLKAIRDKESAEILKRQCEQAEIEEMKKAPLKTQMSAWVAGMKIEKFDIDHMVSNRIYGKFLAFKLWAEQEIVKI